MISLYYLKDDIIFINADSDNAILFSDDMALNTIDFNNINLVDDDFDEEDPDTSIDVRLIAWCNRYKEYKAWKKG